MKVPVFSSMPSVSLISFFSLNCTGEYLKEKWFQVFLSYSLHFRLLLCLV